MSGAVSGASDTPTPYAVHCEGLLEGYSCGLVYLTPEEYARQMSQPHRTWRCPRCLAEAWWDDDIYEVVSWENSAWHAGVKSNPTARIVDFFGDKNPNRHSVGIAFVCSIFLQILIKNAVARGRGRVDFY